MKQRLLSDSYLSSFCLELSMLFNAGVPQADAILMVQGEEPDKAARAVLQSLIDTLDGGLPLSAALDNSGHFPHYMKSMVETGEKTGKLAGTMKALSEHYERQDRLAIAIRSAVLYPSVLLILMLAVVLILIVKVLPIFNDVFRQLGGRMSPVATTLMNFGFWLRNASAAIASVCAVVFVTALLIRLVPRFRNALATAFTFKFGDRGIFSRISNSRFISAITIALSSGMGVEDAVNLASTVSGGSPSTERRHALCADLIRAGNPLPDAMREAGILGARDCRMLKLGRHGGMTDAALEEIAKRTERGVNADIDALVSKIEPALVIVTSVIVGIILLSVMLPLVSIMTAIG